MNTAEVLPVSHFKKLEAFPHLSFWIDTDENQVIAVTKCQFDGPEQPRSWAFTIVDGKPKAFGFKLYAQQTIVQPCPNPADYPSGAALIQALHPWKSWQQFIDQVKTPELYTGHLTFHLEYEPQKAACMETVKPNASKGLVVAVVNGTEKAARNKGSFTVEAYLSIQNALGYEPPNNNNILFSRMSTEWIAEVTTVIDEKTARLVHPALFEHLDEHLAPRLSSKKP